MSKVLYLFLAALAFGGAVYTQEDLRNGLEDILLNYGIDFNKVETPSSVNEQVLVTTTNSSSLKIATWNVENFGKSKATDPSRISVIADKISGYDIVAIQEVSNIHEMVDPGCSRNFDSKDHTNYGLIKKSLESLLPSEYGIIISPQVKDERYMYVYNTSKVRLDEAYVIDDNKEKGELCDPTQEGLMHRQPYVAHFTFGNFDFALMSVHTSPSSNLEELVGLDMFYRRVLNGTEQEVIILGDLNADCSYLSQEDKIALREFKWIVDDSEDTTVSKTDCAYDRFVLSPSLEKSYLRYGIDRNVSDDVSDHYIVWAQFDFMK